ncbi:MAG: hypothetical protein V4812_17760, partial [Pseudomonadota bacterium]
NQTRHGTHRWVLQNERRVISYRIKTDPSLRVARITAPFGVAKLGKGMTIARVPRLAWNPYSRQRNT